MPIPVLTRHGLTSLSIGKYDTTFPRINTNTATIELSVSRNENNDIVVAEFIVPDEATFDLLVEALHFLGIRTRQL